MPYGVDEVLVGSDVTRQSALVSERMPRMRGSVRRLFYVGLLTAGLTVSSCSSTPAKSDSSVLPTNGSEPAHVPSVFVVGSHCGVGWLGLPVDGRFWITDEAKGARDWMPDEWAATQSIGANLITLTVELSTDRQQLTASLAGRSVVYRPVAASDPVVECE